MNNKYYILVCIFFVFAITTYSFGYKSNKEDLRRLNINADNFKSSGNLSDFLEVVKLIPLETTKESLINEVDKVVRFEENIYILDRKSQRILWFNHIGKYLGQIGQIGKGPGEYIEIQDFQVDTIQHLIYLLDVRKVHTFSTTGNFVNTTRIEFMGSQMHRSNKGEFIFYGAGTDDRIFITSSEFHVVSSFFPYSLAYRLDPTYPLSVYKERTIFQISGCDTIYTLVNGKPKALFYFDFNGKNFTEKDFNRLSIEEQNGLFEYVVNSGRYVRCIGFLPLQNSALITMVFSKASYWGIYNLNNNQYSFVKMKNLNNDIFGSFMYFHPKGVTNTEYIFSIPPDKLIHDKSSSFYIRNIAILNGINELSNPILLLAKTKF